MKTLGSALAARAQERPEHPAIICDDTVVTYARLHRASNRLGNALLADGLSKGDRVAFLGKESETYYEIAMGCAKTGVVLVPINWRLTRPEVDHILRDSGSSLVFVEPELADSLPPGVNAVYLDKLAMWHTEASDEVPRPEPGPEDAMVQIYTSGTTGLPKGVVLPHRCFFTFPDSMRLPGYGWMDWRDVDVSLIALPAFQIAGFSWAMQGFYAGITNVVMRMFVAQEALALLSRHRVSITFVAPAMLQMMLAEPKATRESFASLRKVAYGGSPINETLLTRCMEMLPAQLLQIYSCTEAGNVVTLLPPMDHHPGSTRLISAGKACPGVEIEIVDRSGVAQPPGTVGEICIKTPSVMLEYWRLPDATAATLRDGWLHTGDAGHLDADGYLYIGDRMKDMIIVAGQNVYPAEVEAALAKHPAVAEVAVVGIPDERWGEAIQACVVPKAGAQVRPRELMMFLKGRIADFKVPSRWDMLEVLPRNPAGKVLRRELRERYWQGMSRKVN